jgi:hypothetical protein
MSMDVLKRHLAKPYIMELKDKDGKVDEIQIQPLKGKYLVDFMLLLKDLNSLEIEVKTELELKAMTPEENARYELEEGQKFFNNMNESMLGRLDKLVTVTLEDSFAGGDKEILEGFKMAHPFELFMAVMKCNTPAVSVK